MAVWGLLILLGPGVGVGCAWNDTGHKAVALIAYRELVANQPKIAGKLLEILKEHPHYEEYLAKGKPDDVKLEEWVVMRAATWADWARDKPDYHRGTWHYVNIPLIAPDADDETRLKIEKDFSSSKSNHGDVLVAFPDCRRVLRNTSTKADQRAIRLCWILHLVGDIHQPMHATALCTKKFIGGDRGGNDHFVRRQAGDTINLHAFWDNILDNGEKPDLEMTTRDIQKNVAVSDKERKILEIGTWAEESHELSRDYAYMPKGKLIELSTEKNGEAPQLSKEYEAKALEVGRKRIHLAGLRLADVLVADLKN